MAQPPRLDQLPPFARLAVFDDPGLPAALAEVSWDAETVAAWWTTVKSLANPPSQGGIPTAWHFPRRLTESPDDREARLGQVMAHLGHGVPEPHRDVARLKAFLSKNRVWLDCQAQALAAWVGPEAFWEWRDYTLEMDRPVQTFDQIVNLFAQLPEPRRQIELDRGFERLQNDLSVFHRNAGTSTNQYPTAVILVRYFPDVYAAAPDWPRWPDLVRIYRTAGIQTPELEQVHHAVALVERGRLDATLPAAVPQSPRPRM